MKLFELIAIAQKLEKKYGGDINVLMAGDYYSVPVERVKTRLLYEEYPGDWRTYFKGAQSVLEDRDYEWVPAVPVLTLEIS